MGSGEPQFRYVLRTRWSSELVAGSPSSINYPTPHTFSIVGRERGEVAAEVRRLVGDVRPLHCSWQERIENRLQERLLLESLPPGSALLREWNGAWVVQPWDDEIWDERADLYRTFFVLDPALTAADVVTLLAKEPWDHWAPRKFSLAVEYVVGTRTHAPDLAAASIVGVDVDRLTAAAAGPVMVVDDFRGGTSLLDVVVAGGSPG
jgi:hypothetical protein